MAAKEESVRVAQVDDRGNCYGTGTQALEFRVDDGRRFGRCRECGRWIGLVGSSSDRLTHHTPTSEVAPNPHRYRNVRLAARMNVATWLGTERREYADVKYAEDGESRLKLEMQNFGLSEDGEWWVFITNYLKRAQLLGLDTTGGRQAMGKCIVTMMHALETSVEVFGELPKPGVPSGTIEKWVR
jgi:hypothetical protein